VKDIYHTIKNRVWKSFSPLRYIYFRLIDVYCDLFCESAVVSYQKSGRTWLRVMLAKTISLTYDVKKLDLDIFKLAINRPDVPKIAFTHSLPGIGIYPIDLKRMLFSGVYSKSEKVKIRNSLKKKRIVLLVRDPRDVIVSLYFELTKRQHFYDGDISQFIREKYTLKKIIKYMNMWYTEMERRNQDFLLLKYEDLKMDTFVQLKRVVVFLGIDANDQIIAQAVDYGSFENMRKLEKSDKFGDTRLSSRNQKDIESYKVRKGKIGGYKEYLKRSDIDYINKLIDYDLVKGYGY